MDDRLAGLPEMSAGFVEPMLCEPVKAIPDGPEWMFEVKLDGFRLLAVKRGEGGVELLSRNNNSLNRKYLYVADAMAGLPPGTVLDGELVALDPKGRSDFTLIQFFRGQAANIYYYAFDVLCVEGRDVRGLPLGERRGLLKQLLEGLPDKVRLSESADTVDAMMGEVRARKLEGVIAKRRDSLYEAGERSGAWVKHRVNQGQEFVVGGYVPGTHGFDSLVIGYYSGAELIYVHRLRTGFTPALREEVAGRLRGLEVDACPFANLPQEGAKSRWGGEGFTAEKMKSCVWLRPEVVVQVEFLEWNTSLRHAKFVGVREDKDPRTVVRGG